VDSTVDMRSGLRAMGALRPEQPKPEEPVALEMTVLATGARPGGASAKRELFTEETQTVLVFERGAVIRLSAAVADGQLLFLTNKKTGKEVVAQVVRKRSFRPTSCYVDLEFTEACPEFWGIEFPKSAAASPADPAATGTLAEVDSDASPVVATAPPDLQEVVRLKKEVSELQTQLKSLIGSAKSGDPNGATTPESSSVPKTEQSQELTREQHEAKLLEQLVAQEAEQERLHGPTRLVAYPKKSLMVSAAKKAGKVALGGAALAVVASVGVAAYRFGLLDSWVGKRPAIVSAQPPVVHTTEANKPSGAAKSSATPPAAVVPAATVLGGDSKPTADPAKSLGLAAKPAINPVVVPAELPSSAKTSAAGSRIVKTPSKPSRKESKSNSYISNAAPVFAATQPALKATGDVNTAHSSEAIAAGTATGDDYVGPRLVHAVRPVSPPDALRNYVTGNVNVDAVVDTTGHVKHVTVISGPEKLRKAAIEQMSAYLYQPARKNGKTVESHVQASLQFWYEP